MEKFSVLVVYEDLLTHNRAREICDHLLDHFWGDLEFDVTWWSFRTLQEADVAQQASRLATQANLILIAAHASPGLPEHVQRWCESWGAIRRGTYGALAALVGAPQEGGAVPIIAYLQRFAKRAHLDFLPRAVGGAETRSLASSLGGIQITHDLNWMLDPRRPPPHWGINE